MKFTINVSEPVALTPGDVTSPPPPNLHPPPPPSAAIRQGINWSYCAILLVILWCVSFHWFGFSLILTWFVLEVLILFFVPLETTNKFACSFFGLGLRGPIEGEVYLFISFFLKVVGRSSGCNCMYMLKMIGCFLVIIYILLFFSKRLMMVDGAKRQPA